MYEELGVDRLICCDCLVIRHNGFSVGKGLYISCHLHEAQNIIWYYQATYGYIKENCGYHGIDSDSEGYVIDIFSDM